MSLKLGTTDINKIYLGSTEIKKAYLGTTLVYDKTAAPNGLLNNLVSYYKCDTNGSFPDAHGSNNGTINGATFTSSGLINGAYEYDGTNDGVDVTVDIGSTTNFTLSQWINADDVNKFAQRTFARGTFGNDLAIQIFQQRIRGIIGQDGGGTSIGGQTQVILNSIWYFVVLTFDGSDLKIYLNGVLQNTTSMSTTIGSGAVVSSIGYDTNENKEYFDGTIDEIGIWSRTLSQSDITTLYNSGSGLSYDSFTT